ncbi:MAG: hypothetical protein C3F12_02695 [Candidatus Methylomirabilota bacterium]|nr:MAG: hypothetical protein C3F12_02695 [candidate division NC10 bacterium]
MRLEGFASLFLKTDDQQRPWQAGNETARLNIRERLQKQKRERCCMMTRKYHGEIYQLEAYLSTGVTGLPTERTDMV